MSEAKKIALVTGANRGIGFEVSKQLSSNGYTVLMGCRDVQKGEAAVKQLRNLGLNASFLELDVSNPQSIERAYDSVLKNYGRLDVLVNNAGVFRDDFDNSTAFKADPNAILETFRINALGPFMMCQKFIPLMKKNNYGRVVNISSGMGQLSEMNGGFSGYRISKTALNAVTKIFADELDGTDILVNSVCPGWVKTDMGGAGAEREVEKGAETPVWLALLPKGSKTGGFFRDKEEIDW